MKITGKTRVLGIIGWPVAHSLSPVMHNAAFKYLGLDFCYIPFSVKERSFDSAIKGIPALNIGGLNITVPYKERVLSCLSEISKEAKRIGFLSLHIPNPMLGISLLAINFHKLFLTFISLIVPSGL